MRRMGRHAIVVGLAIGVAVVLGASVSATQQEEMSASKAWVKLPAAGETTAAAFVAVNNPTMYDAYLISASSDVADKVEFRLSADESVAEITVPAYGGLGMEPDGVHLILTDLKRPLEEDERISITFKTDGESITVSAVVRKE